ncbi:MAG: histidine--tRNA ligase [Candidatus Eremiobacterota bacterium]
MTVRSVRGTRDLLPEDTPRWQYLEEQARHLAQSYGYREIRTPLFEKADLFVRGMGVLAGLVERELWTFHDKFGQKLALRADVTASVVRAFYEHGLGERDGQVQKLYYLAPVFLVGKESEEGSRQCHQFGVEAMGSAQPTLDAEVMALAWAYFKRIGLPGVRFELNSLGCDKCRPPYHEALREYFSAHSNELCATCKRKHKTHPLWTLGCPERSCVELAQVAPTMFGTLCPNCKLHFQQLKDYLTELGLPVELNPRVVRDLEYYNRTIFQITHQGRVLGTGGRYDDLVETLGGPDTPAVGFAVHLEAVLDALEGTEFPAPAGPTVYLSPEGAEATRLLLPVLNRLREAGIYAELDYSGRSHHDVPDSARFVVSLSEKDAGRTLAQVLDRRNEHKDRLQVLDVAHRIAAKLGMSSAMQPVERPVKERETRQRGRRNGALRGRYFNVESDLEVHYDRDVAAPAAPVSSESGNSRSKRKRRRRRGDDGEAPTAAPSVREDRVQEEEVRSEERSSRSRRRRGRRGPESEGARSAPREDRYDEERDRSRSRSGYSDDPEYYERGYDEDDRYREQDRYYDEPEPTYRREDRYYEEDDYRAEPERDRDRGRRSEPERSSRNPERGAGRSGSGRSEKSTGSEPRRSSQAARSQEPRYVDDYPREDSYESRSRRRPEPSYEDGDDGPQPVDSKLALLESSRAASRYRSSVGDGQSSSRSGGGGKGRSGNSRRRRSRRGTQEDRP